MRQCCQFPVARRVRKSGAGFADYLGTPIERLDLAANTKLESLSIEGTQLSVLNAAASTECDFVTARRDRLVSVHGAAGVTYNSGGMLGGQNPYTLGVSGEDGFDFSAVDPDFDPAAGSVWPQYPARPRTAP